MYRYFEQALSMKRALYKFGITIIIIIIIIIIASTVKQFILESNFFGWRNQ